MGELAERGTPQFYREQAARLTLLAAASSSAEGRLALLEMAAVCQKLADRAATVAPLGDVATAGP
jgi:hypothetical protein